MVKVPAPILHGWDFIAGVYQAKSSETPVAPDCVINLIKCKCGSDCLSRRCKCTKNGLVCTELCDCGDSCENTDLGRFVNDEGLDEDEMFDEMLL